jgi:hypothetical protein
MRKRIGQDGRSAGSVARPNRLGVATRGDTAATPAVTSTATSPAACARMVSIHDLPKWPAFQELLAELEEEAADQAVR